MFAVFRLSQTLDDLAYLAAAGFFLVVLIGGVIILIAAFGSHKIADSIQTADPGYENRLQDTAVVTGHVMQIRENRPRIPGNTAYHDYHVAVAYNRDGDV